MFTAITDSLTDLFFTFLFSIRFLFVVFSFLGMFEFVTYVPCLTFTLCLCRFTLLLVISFFPATADDESTFILPEPSSSYVPGLDDDLDFFFDDPEFHLVPECSLFNGCDCAYLKYSITPVEVVSPVENY
ncbi:hypothetical protein BDF21DRAFT_428437 [Thamnidium elegans]|nr:hypothetical protein BDF21DRAFT_428437 [Thamnidium elegans]